jgi:hypothetical protein
MKRLALLAAALATSCAAANAPPVQVKDPLPEAPSASPSVGRDMANDDGKMPDAPPPSAPTEAFQSVTGTLGGKPWELKGAGTTGQVQADGNVQIVLANYPVDCTVHTPGPDDRTITLLIPWKAKMRLDLGALSAKEASAAAMDEKKKKPAAIRGFKPKGTLDVVAAPTKLNSSGRIKIDLTSGKEDAVKAEIPVRFCYSS